MCPNCKRSSRCGCGSPIHKTKLPRLRVFKFVKGDFIKCPYCRQINHTDIWENESYKNYLKERLP